MTNTKITWKEIVEKNIDRQPVMISAGGAIGLYIVKEALEVGKTPYLVCFILDPETHKPVGGKWINTEQIVSFSILTEAPKQQEQIIHVPGQQGVEKKVII